jgi:hypothetical protein
MFHQGILKSALSNNSISNDNKQKAIEQVVSAVKKLSLEDNSEGNATTCSIAFCLLSFDIELLESADFASVITLYTSLILCCSAVRNYRLKIIAKVMLSNQM